MKLPFAPLCLIIVIWAVTGSLRADDETFAAKAYLEGKGLKVVGNNWVVPGEVELQRRIEGLEFFEKRYVAAARNAEAAIYSNEQIRGQLATAEAAAQREAARKNPPAAQPAGAAQAIAEAVAAAEKKPPPPPTKLHSSLPDVTGLGELSPLQNAMIELVGSRIALTLAVLKARQLRTKVEAQYQTLRGDSEVTLALKTLGGKQRLGPARTDDRTAQRIDLLSEQVFTANVPVYWESQRYRVGVLLNETTPATFSFYEANEPTLLTDSLAQTLGIAPSESSPRRTHGHGKRVFAVREVQLPPLRIGKYVFTGIHALLLPPEAEDLGCQFSASALDKAHAVIEPRAMTLHISQ